MDPSCALHESKEAIINSKLRGDAPGILDELSKVGRDRCNSITPSQVILHSKTRRIITNEPINDASKGDPTGNPTAFQKQHHRSKNGLASYRKGQELNKTLHWQKDLHRKKRTAVQNKRFETSRIQSCTSSWRTFCRWMRV